MTQTLKVEYEELIARAAEIEEPLPPVPSTNPPGPCTLSFVNDAATQLALSADSLRLYLKTCEREWKALAKSLRNAAKAYEEVDEGAAESMNAIGTDGSSSGAGPAAAGTNNEMSASCDPDEDWGRDPLPSPKPPPAFDYPYYEVRQAAKAIEAGDQGTSFRAFAKEWDAFQREFQKTAYRFRPFVSWEGESRDLVEANFEIQRQWILSMAQMCVTLGSQANRVVDAHKKARITYGDSASRNQDGTWAVEAEHPTNYEVELNDWWYKNYSQNYPHYLYMAVSWYESLQAKSESSLALYVSNAGLPMTPINPKMPPRAEYIPPPPDPNAPEDGIDDGLPVGDAGGFPAAPMMPTLPSGMGGAPDKAAMDAAMKDALKGKGGMPGGAGLKPASLGGGGGAGVPGMPLQPSVDAEAASRPAGAAPGAAGPGRAMPGAGGAAGGGMGGGMAPMGGPGQGQNQGKGKRVQSDDESLYTEERSWTEGVIGNRPRKTAPDK
jgi:ESX-1 secreted protein B PE domain